jgi:hypothetical protein
MCSEFLARFRLRGTRPQSHQPDQHAVFNDFCCGAFRTDHDPNNKK